MAPSADVGTPGVEYLLADFTVGVVLAQGPVPTKTTVREDFELQLGDQRAAAAQHTRRSRQSNATHFDRAWFVKFTW